jgi:hypothetical protein
MRDRSVSAAAKGAAERPCLVIELLQARATMGACPTSPRPPDMVDHVLPTHRCLRVAMVTETYPPEVNGVALTWPSWWRACARAATRATGAPAPGQGRHGRHGGRASRGADARPAHSALPAAAMGVPSKHALLQLWGAHPPGRGAHRHRRARWAGRRCRRPRSCGCPWCRTSAPTSTPTPGTTASAGCASPIMAYLRKFHNRTHAPWCPRRPCARNCKPAASRA